jgi:hypothetical protein
MDRREVVDHRGQGAKVVAHARPTVRKHNRRAAAGRFRPQLRGPDYDALDAMRAHRLRRRLRSAGRMSRLVRKEAA